MEQEYIDRRDDDDRTSADIIGWAIWKSSDDRTSADIIGWAIWKSSGRLSRSCNVEIAKEVYELAQRKRCMEKKYDTFADALEFIRTEIGDLDTVLKIYPELRTVHLALYDELWAFYSVPSTDVNKALEDDSTDDDDDDEEESTVTAVIPDSNAWGAASSSALSCSPPSKKSSSQLTATQKQTTTKKGNTQQRVSQKMTHDELRAFYHVPSTDVNKALEDDSTDDAHFHTTKLGLELTECNVVNNIMRGEDAK